MVKVPTGRNPFKHSSKVSDPLRNTQNNGKFHVISSASKQTQHRKTCQPHHRKSILTELSNIVFTVLSKAVSSARQTSGHISQMFKRQPCLQQHAHYTRATILASSSVIIEEALVEPRLQFFPFCQCVSPEAPTIT